MKKLGVVLCLLALLPASSFARGIDWGVRGGLTVDPDQVHVGGHADLGPVGNHVSLIPNLEVGFGNDLTVVALNCEAAYRFETKWEAWSPYAGGGLGLFFINYDNNGVGSDGDTEVGLSILGGIERGMASGGRFFVESKIGLNDAPDLKFTVGWTFGR